MATVIIKYKFDSYYLDEHTRRRLQEAIATTMWKISGIRPREEEIDIEFDCPEYEEMGEDL